LFSFPAHAGSFRQRPWSNDSKKGSAGILTRMFGSRKLESLAPGEDSWKFHVR
jgi:hypothetical protein